MAVPLSKRIVRRGIRALLSPMLQWEPLREPKPGFTIFLGVPWDLRELLSVNLRFVSKTDLAQLDRLLILFDRTPKPGAEEFINGIRKEFPRLPLEFHFYPRLAGSIVEAVNISTWYNSMNCAVGLKACRTKHAILHDFDLYPLVPNYFNEVLRAMRERELRFCGLEHTFFDGLEQEDGILGTWCLGMDVQWLRESHRPIHIFQRVAKIRGRLAQLDPFSWIQMRTPARGLVATIDGKDCCHVRNLCGTYVRYKIGRNPRFAWRLHYLWYLQSVCGYDALLEQVMEAMETATSSRFRMGGFETDFARTHVTCANVLKEELTRMEEALFGECRRQVTTYVEAFRRFLERWGDNSPLPPTGASAKLMEETA